MEDKKVYNKLCIFCGKAYQSTSRGQRYCSEECCTKANERNKAIKKKRAKANKERKEHELENRLITRAYSLCSFTAETFRLPQCNCPICQGEKQNNELHHFDANVFNNDPNNIVNLCNTAHKVIHNNLPDVSNVKVLSQALQAEDTVAEYNRILNEIWTNWLQEKGLDMTKEEYLQWLRDNLQSILQNHKEARGC